MLKSPESRIALAFGVWVFGMIVVLIVAVYITLKVNQQMPPYLQGSNWRTSEGQY